MTRQHRPLVLGFFVLAAAWAIAAQLGIDKAGDKSCSVLLSALDMPPIKQPFTREKRGEITTLRWGEQMCTYDAKGRARGAIDIAQLQPTKGVPPKLRDAKAVLMLATAKSVKAGFSLRDPDVVPSMPWGNEPGVVQISSMSKAYGHPTNGFAGGLRMQVNRISGKVASLAYTPEFTPDKPNVKITKERALSLAEGALRRKKEPGRDYVTRAILQYFRPSPIRATSEGKRLLATRHLRFCWVVTLSMGKKLSDMSAPVTSMAIDAETGKQISVP